MNAGQEQFFNFMMERVADDKKDEAKSMMDECFTKQDEGSFSPLFLAGIVPKMLGTVKPECLSEVKEVFEKFASQLGK